MSSQFDHVSVIKKSNVYFGGSCISHTVQFADGTKKTLGVILPTEQALTFETHVPERMEIISGECRVRIADSEEQELFRAGQSFYVPGNSKFKIETPVLESSAPVGSSHKSIDGFLATALAIETLCCSPPDNCEGN